jgi:pimeloyl-ACP methyl ester carboxylesterase
MNIGEQLMLRASCILSLVMMAGAAPAAVQAQAQALAQAQSAAPSSPSQPATGPAAFVRPQAPGRLVDVGGRRLHILCKGAAAGPTVIFEAGLSQFTANSSFSVAQDAIAPFARVCSYDRAGLGWSDPAPQGWTQAGMAADLHALLAATGEPGPYVIVAHSIGGLLARTYARTHGVDVAGLILLDATSDEDFDELAAAGATIIPQLDAAIGSSRPGVPVIGMPAGTSPEVVMAFTPELLRGVKTEFEALDRLPAEMKRPGGFGALGDLPLIVVRRGKTEQPPSEADLRHQRVQENLAKLSTKGSLIVAQNSGHTIPLDEPEVVADAVRRMLDARRSQGDGR